MQQACPTVLIDHWQAGDRVAGNTLFTSLQRELETIAAARLAHESSHSLSSGDLINEAVIRIMALTRMQIESKAHMLAMASRMMRQVLVDRARARARHKRSGERVTLVTDIPDVSQSIELLELDSLLADLRKIDPQRADIVEMRFFGGMSIPDVATALGISEMTVKRRWAACRAWLMDRLQNTS